MNLHLCISPTCDNQYSDEDPDPYYCPTCRVKKKALAAEIDRKLSGRVSTRSGPSFDEQVAGMAQSTIKDANGGERPVYWFKA